MSVDVWGTDERTPTRGPDGEFYPRAIYLKPEDPRGLNMANANARLVLTLLGLQSEEAESELWGQCTIPEARRAVIRARARFDRMAPSLTRASYTEARREVCADGVVEIRPWLHVAGVDLTYLGRQIDRFAAVVEVLAQNGATHVSWG